MSIMSLFSNIKAIGIAIGGVALGIFYFIFQSTKKENRELKEEIDSKDSQLEAQKRVHEVDRLSDGLEIKKVNEKLNTSKRKTKKIEDINKALDDTKVGEKFDLSIGGLSNAKTDKTN